MDLHAVIYGFVIEEMTSRILLKLYGILHLQPITIEGGAINEDKDTGVIGSHLDSRLHESTNP